MKCKHCISLIPKIIAENINVNEEVDFLEHINTCPNCKDEYLLQKTAINELTTSIQSPSINSIDRLPDIMVNINMNRYKNKKLNRRRIATRYLKNYAFRATSIIVIIFSLIVISKYALKDIDRGVASMDKKEKSVETDILIKPNSAKLLSINSIPKPDMKELPSNYSYKSFYDTENLIVTDKNNNAGEALLYNIKTGSLKPFIKASLDKSTIQYINYEDNWIVWIEQIKGDENSSTCQWRVAYKSTSDDKSNILAEGLYESKGESSLANLPTISLHKGIVAAQLTDKNNCKIMVYDLKENSSKEIRSLQNQKILNLAIDGDMILWSETTEKMSYSIKFNILSYNLKSAETKTISERTDSSFFDIYKNKVLFAENNNIKLYDINSSIYTSIVNKELPAFENVIDKEFFIYNTGPFFLSNDYMVFKNNNKLYVYDLKNNVFYDLMESILNQSIGHINNVIFNNDSILIRYTAENHIKDTYIDLKK